MPVETTRIVARLSALEGTGPTLPRPGIAVMEFHVSREARERFGVDERLCASSGNVIMPDFRAIRLLAQSMNEKLGVATHPERAVKAGQLNAMVLLDEIFHYVCALYRSQRESRALELALDAARKAVGAENLDALLLDFTERFPPVDVWKGRIPAAAWLDGSEGGVPNRALALEELMLLKLAHDNPALGQFGSLFDDTALAKGGAYAAVVTAVESLFEKLPPFGPDNQDLFGMLRSPVAASPFSLAGQLEYIRSRWGLVLGSWLTRLLSGLDFIREEDKPHFPGPGPARVLVYEGLEREYERFTPDKDWMPRVVMMAKSTLVWLSQLSAAYGRDIRRLDQIPDEELDRLAARGFNSLWLIGLWERSDASARIKHLCGNPEAAASAYSLFGYEIAGELGGWPALENLRERCGWRGIKLASDMVPNHTGIDSDWVRNRPDLFISSPYPPFPGYAYSGENLSGDPNVGVWLEDHYYSRSDAAVTFKRHDFRSGDTRYVYHGNDGTSMPWNDTAQIDFLNPAAREAVIQQILHVARAFPVIRFDAAMVLAKKHIRRLWYPEPGQGGDIPSRAERALSREEFDARIPEEFWREVVDRCAAEAPDTLLLAEAFWMLEGYFVRTLGMHRVYNSAFMNMLKREENDKYRATIKNTQEFDKDILKRFVNFMNNPDEETAVAQFGSGDKYFGVCTMMVTMPGLPMFGHGQVEGFAEKYGMEYRRAYYDEKPDSALVERHEREIFPLMKRRHVFSGVERFVLYDLYAPDGSVNENVFAYSNEWIRDRALVLFNNAYGRASGWIRESAAWRDKEANALARTTVGAALGLSDAHGRFLLMREQRSDLWFLRRSSDVVSKGLFVQLDGYQCQVFLDAVEIADNAHGQYGALCDILNGAGVRDVAAAMQDVFLKDLYDALRTLASPERFKAERERAVALLAPPAAAAKTAAPAAAPETAAVEAKAGLADVERAATALHETVRLFIEGTSYYAAFAPETPKRPARSATAAAQAAAQAAASAEPSARAGTAFAGRLEALRSLVAEAAKPRSGLPLLARGFRDHPHAPEFALAYLVMSWLRLAVGDAADGADARALVDHFRLDRKLREILEECGVPGSLAWETFGVLKVVLPRSGAVTIAAESAPGRAASGHDEAASAAELRDAIGVNIYDGVVWFNKERFEALSFYAALALALDAPEPDARKAERFLRAMLDAAAESGYRFEELGRLLSAGDRPSTAPAAKTERAAPAKRAARAKADEPRSDAAPAGGAAPKAGVKPKDGAQSPTPETVAKPSAPKRKKP